MSNLFLEIKQKKGLKDFFLIALIILFTIGLYYPTLSLNFLSDDYDFLEEAALVNDFSSLLNYLTLNIGGKLSQEVFRPILDLSFLLDYKIWGMQTIGYRSTNLLIFFTTLLLIYLLGKFYFKNTWIAFSAALFFAILPNHHESVTWLAGRTDVLATFFILGSVYFWNLFWIRRSKYFYFISLGSFLLAIFSKEIAVALPFLIILTDFVFLLEAKISIFKFIKKRILFYLPYLATIGFYIYIRSIFVGGANSWSVGTLNQEGSFLYPLKYFIKLPLYFLTYIVNFDYLKSVIPSEYVKLITWTQKEILWLVLFLFLLLLLYHGKKIVKWKFWKNIIFCLLWIYLAGISAYFLLPYIGTNLSNTRFIYLSSVGFCFLLAFLIFRNKRWNVVNMIYLVTISIAFTFCFIFNLQPWKIANAESSQIIAKLNDLLITHTFTKDDRIYLAKLPDNVFGAYVFRNGIAGAAKLFYQEDLKVEHLERGTLQEKVNNYYVFAWDNKEKIFITRENVVEDWENRNILKELYFKRKEKNTWDFSLEEDFKVWSPSHDLVSNKKEDYPILNYKGKDPYLVSPNIDLSTVIFDKLIIEIEIEGLEEEIVRTDIYWTTDTNPKFQENEQHLKFYNFINSETKILEFDLSEKPAWVFSGKLDKIRIDLPLNKSIKSVKIKNIKLTKN